MYRAEAENTKQVVSTLVSDRFDQGWHQWSISLSNNLPHDSKSPCTVFFSTIVCIQQKQRRSLYIFRHKYVCMYVCGVFQREFLLFFSLFHLHSQSTDRSNESTNHMHPVTSFRLLKTQSFQFPLDNFPSAWDPCNP